MNVLFAAAECAPFFKTGGLGDVIGALPNALAEKKTTVSVVLPYFPFLPEMYQKKCKKLIRFQFDFNGKKRVCTPYSLKKNQVTYYFLKNEDYFERKNIYGYEDDGERFAFFSCAILQMMDTLNNYPEIIHVNDYHTAVLPLLLKTYGKHKKEYAVIKSMLTIHNIEFQGEFNPENLQNWFQITHSSLGENANEFSQTLNFLKTGILYADHITTVSPTYAKEIQTTAGGNGLDKLLQKRKIDLTGILNGIDDTEYDQKHAPDLVQHYSAETINKKYINKADLQKKCHLPVDKEKMLMGIVSRLTKQKGMNLLADVLSELVNEEIQLVVLGTGDPRCEKAFQEASKNYPQVIQAYITFDNALAQQIYAGADLFLMPSAFEPCGLSQMISMRYGTIPLVHETGGLKDTVISTNEKNGIGTGFGFEEFTTQELKKTIQSALDTYQKNQLLWKQIMQTGMAKDFSWEKASQQYIDVYEQLLHNH
ncbi:glycogen synthase GlgA [Melissococcus plutonius]|uniref:glycogen synthase GlgA n=1 Tax=Melissococcus plutonius TaxID=33970 RepID=UPI00065E9281|nr:glycogen synthase GlgA [Melissococcus plutonius]AIM25865.1 glycogen synthase GlgA [Melissococcus plutonius S1]KMT23834.1 glycogen synthase GlgA [Melissococcus plutonius]KMT24357.1 glycogen synthase GlgA [Melissococcus plutonius]KMT25930.1 glycogen synthase GlgA [Melissococcus plutonius]KMT28481.1 glycogen synthase GlgA [Melissococcus plutonius]